MLSSLMKILLSLRYRVTVRGLEAVPAERGIIIIPNHPAEIDPVIVTTFLWDLLKPQPVVLESVYKTPLLTPIMRQIKAIPMPDMDFDSGPYKRRRIQRALDDVVTRLKNGENILIYPSGRLSVTGVEKLGGASGFSSILKQHPNVPVLMVRIRGLYGSIFSRALTEGHSPDIIATIKRGASLALQNLLFFAPRRNVTIDLVYNPLDLPRDGDTLTVNRYLENFYNSPEPETPRLVPYTFWNPALPLIPQRPDESHALDEVPENVRVKVFEHLAKIAQTGSENLSYETRLGDDLGFDSLTIAEILLWLDREFEAHDIELSEIVSVGSVVRAASGQLATKAPKKEFVVPHSWTERLEERPSPDLNHVSSIGAAFLDRANQMGSLPAMGDERSGVLSWSDLKLRTILLARTFSTLKGKHVGLLFPASVAGSISAMACILAGKIPVFLNWTSGKRALLHACETTELSTIITSQSFLDIVQTDLEFLEDRFLFLEEVVANLSAKEKLAASRLSQEANPQLKDAFGVSKCSPWDPAVVLFTSGSEALPKGVILTHENILSNIRGVLGAVHLDDRDVLLGFLPTFHSFGLTICTLLPLVTGLRVAYHPNPNESRKIARAIKTWGATLMAGTPTFLRSILQAGTTDQFGSLKYMVSGAERAPQDLFDRAARLPNKVTVLEGYGITECSPVVSVNRPDEPRVGVGKPLDGTTIKIVHPATHEPLPEGSEGLILIHSPCVFPGYTDPALNPFIDIGGIRFYNSGDIGRLENGALVICGRLKRFIKIAGEMVSLTAVEEALQKELAGENEAPSIAVLAQGAEGDGRPSLTLFSSQAVTPDEVNKILRSSGFPHLVAIARVERLKELPLLGSGKVDYQQLKGMLGELK